MYLILWPHNQRKLIGWGEIFKKSCIKAIWKKKLISKSCYESDTILYYQEIKIIFKNDDYKTSM